MEEKLKLKLGLKGVLDRKVLRDEKDLSQETKENVGKSQGLVQKSVVHIVGAQDLSLVNVAGAHDQKKKVVQRRVHVIVRDHVTEIEGNENEVAQRMETGMQEEDGQCGRELLII